MTAGNDCSPLMHAPTVLKEADVVLMESTYGDRDHRSHEDTIEELATKLEGVDPKAFLKTIKEWNEAVMTEVPFNPAVKDVSAEVWYLDGSNETLRSRYNDFTNTEGRYAFELSREGPSAKAPVVAVRAQVLSPLLKPATVEAIAANAASVGANTVNGPLPLSVSTRPAACRAVARVLNEPAATAVSTMSAA